jgi:hypothetical protein
MTLVARADLHALIPNSTVVADALAHRVCERRLVLRPEIADDQMPTDPITSVESSANISRAGFPAIPKIDSVSQNRVPSGLSANQKTTRSG